MIYKPKYTTRWQRAVARFRDGEGPLFILAAAMAAVLAYGFIVAILSLAP